MGSPCKTTTDFLNLPNDLVGIPLFGDDGTVSARMVAVCGEPGMGLGPLVTSVLSRASGLGVRTVYRSYATSSAAAASRSLVRLAKQLSGAQGGVVVGIDDIPPSDESCVARQARALRRMREDGASVLIALRPEARQLLESLPECQVVTSAALLARRASATGPAGVSHELFRLTRGIPSLLEALGPEASVTSGDEVPLAYFDALGRLLERSLRSSLCDEERRLRLALILFGRGRVEELRGVLGTVHDDLLADVRENAPLFGISTDLVLFNCLSSVAPGALVSCLRRLAPTCALYPEVVSGCMSALVESGRLARAAALALLPECRGSLGLVVERAPDFIDIGEIRLVLHAAEIVEGADERELATLCTVVASLDTRGLCELPDSSRRAKGATDTALLLFGEARRALWGRAPTAGAEVLPEGDLERRLAAHVGACSLMLRGAFSAALTLLVGVVDEGRGPCVSGALLALDVEVARILTGGAPSARGEEVARAEEFLTHHPLRGIAGYLALHELVSELVCPADDEERGLRDAVMRYESASDALVRVVALLVGAIADLRAGSAGRAQVRAELAESAARGFDGDYLSRLARLLSDVALYVQGGRPGPRVPDDASDDLDQVCTLVWEVFLCEENPTLVSAIDERVPWDGLWLLRVLCTGLGEFSARLADRMPARWRRAAPSASGGGLLRPLPSAERSLRESAGTRPSRPIALSLLGGFSLCVHGKHVPEGGLERRNMKSLLEYLVLRGGHAKRYQIVEQVWPNCDYVLGFNRAYQATSALRSLVASMSDADAPELIVASRASGEISVNMEAVTCDVSEFRDAALEAIDSEDSVWSLECARVAERLYQGDLYMPQSDATGFIAAMRAELKNLYADAMVEGSRAALDLGHDRTAARLAENAVLANDMREDAVTALVRALQSCGRGAEALRQRRAFEGRLARLSPNPS